MARGDGNDYSAFHVIDAERYEQVAEYKGKMAPDQFGHFLVEVATNYNNATLVVENNSVGYACIQKIMNTLNQIRWTFFGALGYYAISEIGLLGVFKVL